MLQSADARTAIEYDGRAHPVINLCSYNYLGLANHPEVIAAATEALGKYGMGACGSPMLSGMTDLHRKLERAIAEFLGREDAMLFNSGFGGALGTLSGLLRKSDVAIMDNRSHLSLRDGAVLSRSRLERFEHNDPSSLDEALSRRAGKRNLVIVEGIYSMDGDFATLGPLLDVAEAHDASVFIDEAHSMLGLRDERPRGGGTLRCRASHPADLRHVLEGVRRDGRLRRRSAGDDRISALLCAFLRLLLCACRPVDRGRDLEVARALDRSTRKRARGFGRMRTISARRRTALGIDTGASNTYIMPLIVGDRGRMYRLGHELRQRGLWVAPVDYPAVPEDRICFRACVTANHTRADLDEALNILEDTLVPDLLQRA